jgi:uncharacterized protein (TIGR02996 family)
MDQELSFLEAIRCQPNSKSVRLVYADWLEERGDPRADFICLQCQAAALAPSSPRRLAAEAVAHDLLLRHEADWLGPLLGHVSNWEFRRGLLDFVTVPAATFLAHAEEWLPRLPLIGVHLRQASGHVAALAACPQLAHLNALYLGDNRLTDDDVAALADSPHLGRLTVLYLQSNRLTEKGVQALAVSSRLPRLRELNLAHNFTRGNAGIRALANAKGLPRLRHLNLAMSRLDEEGLRLLAHSPLQAQLRSLNLTANVLPAGCLTALVESPAFAGVRELLYDMNDASDEDVEALAGSPYVEQLTTLALSSARRPLSDVAVRALAGSQRLRQLTTLHLGGCRLEARGLTALGESRTLVRLRRLDLQPDSDILRSHARDLLGGPLARRLRELSVEGGSIGTAGLSALAGQRTTLALWRLAFDLAPDEAPAWDALLTQGALRRLTQLTLGNLARGALPALATSGRLPRLRSLRLLGLVRGLAETEELLGGPLAGQLDRLELATRAEQGTDGLVRQLAASPAAARLRALALYWPVRAGHLGELARAAWPRLTQLGLSWQRGAAAAQALAAWPVLGQLRWLTLRNHAGGPLNGLKALGGSPHFGPLLRVDFHNDGVPKDVAGTLRQRLGGRLSVAGRKLPRVVQVGGWGDGFGLEE